MLAFYLPVAPSRPICNIQGRAEYFHNITLTCMSEEGSPGPTYDWKSYSVDNSPRQLPPKATQSMRFSHTSVTSKHMPLGLLQGFFPFHLCEYSKLEKG